MVAKRGKVIWTEGKIVDLHGSYKGIPQANRNHEEDARRSATAKYLKKVRQVQRGQLNSGNKIQANNTYMSHGSPHTQLE